MNYFWLESKQVVRTLTVMDIVGFFYTKSMKQLAIFWVLFLITTLSHSQVTIYYDDNCNITMKSLATHYRIAKVDTVLKKFIGEVNDFWSNDTVMMKFSYDLIGNRDGQIKVKNASGDIILTGQYSGGNKSGTWEINKGKSLFMGVNGKKSKQSQVASSLEMCLVNKEKFSVSQYIKKSEYREIYPLISKSLSRHRNVEGQFTVVEEHPHFPNGMLALGQFISAYIKYPADALKNKIKGQVIVEFIITEDGSTKDFKIVQSLGYGCDEEAVRVLQLLPDWVPGYQRGRAVRTKFRLPIKFG